MQRALVCAVLVACKGKTPPEDKRSPAQAPVVVADAAVPDAPSGPCFALPFGMDAERAGIRKLTIRAIVPMPRVTKLPGVTKLVVGKPTRVPGLQPPKDGAALRVPDIGADALVTMAKLTPGGVDLIAPPHTSSAVLRVEGETSALVAVGDEGLVSLIRYRDDYVPTRKVAGKDAGEITTIEPLAIFAADLATEPPLGLVSYSAVSDGARTHLEVGVLWHPSGSPTPQVGYAPLRDTSLPLYVVPPTLSGGAPLLVGADGTRIVVENMTLRLLAVPPGGAPACLQTSTTQPAQFRAE